MLKSGTKPHIRNTVWGKRQLQQQKTRQKKYVYTQGCLHVCVLVVGRCSSPSTQTLSVEMSHLKGRETRSVTEEGRA